MRSCRSASGRRRSARSKCRRRALLRGAEEADALAVIFPEIHALFGVPQPERWHPEIDTGVHTLMVLEQAARLSDDPVVRFAALDARSRQGHDSRERMAASRRARAARRDARREDVRSPAHSERLSRARGARSRDFTCMRIASRNCATRHCSICSRVSMRSGGPSASSSSCSTCEADARGRKGLEDRDYPQAEFLRGVHARAAANVDLDEAARAGLDGTRLPMHCVASASRRWQIVKGWPLQSVATDHGSRSPQRCDRSRETVR